MSRKKKSSIQKYKDKRLETSKRNKILRYDKCRKIVKVELQSEEFKRKNYLIRNMAMMEMSGMILMSMRKMFLIKMDTSMSLTVKHRLPQVI
jgi:hypothetical protein